MEKIIKISSEQGFSQTYVPADVATAPPTLKLLDFVIPANTGRILFYKFEYGGYTWG